MADNNDTKHTTAETPAIDLEVLRPMLKDIIAAELNAALDPIVKRIEKNEQVAGENSRRVSEAFMRITALDLSYRDLQTQSAKAIDTAQQIVGKFTAIREMLDTWTAAAAANGKAIIALQEGYIDLQRDIYGDNTQPHHKSVMGELDKLPDVIQKIVNREIEPVVNRLAHVEEQTQKNTRFILARQAWERRARTVAKAVFNRKTLTGLVSAIVAYVGYSGATGTNILYQLAEILSKLGGGS